MKWPETVRKCSRVALLVALPLGLAHCDSGAATGNANELEAVRLQLEETRKERDSLLEQMDASTRARVELDGEISRLKKEIETLKKGPAEN